MTLAATRRYAFGASVIVGILASIAAVALTSALVTTPEQVAITIDQGDLGALIHLIVNRLADAAHAALRIVVRLM